MNYKKIIPSRKLRLKILKLFSFVPDRTMLKLQYRIKFNRKLDLKNPQRFTEKIQWYKLYYKNPLMIRCVDKSDVRSYIEQIGLGNILTKSYGTFDSVDDIDFDLLPNAFVAKDTLGGGGNAVIVVKNKNEIDVNAVKNTMRNWCDTLLVPGAGREWPYYSGKKHRIFIEEYIEGDKVHGLVDYKFYCFNGHCEYLNLIFDRKLGVNAKMYYLTRDYIDTGAYNPEEGEVCPDEILPKPINYEEMVKVAEKLSVGFPQVRVDLYSNNGEIRFGELTFFDASGYLAWEPDSFDYEIGAKFILPEIIGGGYSEEVIILVYTCCDLQDLEVAA